jgi:hypothetical protein
MGDSEIREIPEWVQQATQKDGSSRFFSNWGNSIDAVLNTPENRGWLVFSLALALILYLFAWFLDDAWYFFLAQAGSKPFPPEVFTQSSCCCGGMACGAFLVLVPLLAILEIHRFSQE